MGCGASRLPVAPGGTPTDADDARAAQQRRLEALFGVRGVHAKLLRGLDSGMSAKRAVAGTRLLADAFLKKPVAWRERARRDVWPLLGAAEQVRLLHGSVTYESLLRCGPSSQDSVISNDVGRTLGWVPLFSEGPGMAALSRMMTAYSHYDPEISYTQGMCFLAGALLITGMDEETAFWLYVSLMTRFGLAGLYRPGFVLLTTFHAGLDVLVKKKMPKLSKRLKSMGLASQVFAMPWVLSCFLSSPLPLSAAMCIIDRLLCDGPKDAAGIFRNPKKGKQADVKTRAERAPIGRGFSVVEASCEHVPPALFQGVLAILDGLQKRVLECKEMDQAMLSLTLRDEQNLLRKSGESTPDGARGGAGSTATSIEESTVADDPSDESGARAVLAALDEAAPTAAGMADSGFVHRDNSGRFDTVLANRLPPIGLREPFVSKSPTEVESDGDADGSLWVCDDCVVPTWMLPAYFEQRLRKRACRVPRKVLSNFKAE